MYSDFKNKSKQAKTKSPIEQLLESDESSASVVIETGGDSPKSEASIPHSLLTPKSLSSDSALKNSAPTNTDDD
jgi:hypothetical protein